MGTKIKELYNLSKNAKVGEKCICPSCGTSFMKTSYQQAFCKSKKGTVCKDKYWNTVTPSKRNNTTRISPASADWMSRHNSKNHSKVPRTSEGYKIINGTAYNEFDEPVYDVNPYEDSHNHGQWTD